MVPSNDNIDIAVEILHHQITMSMVYKSRIAGDMSDNVEILCLDAWDAFHECAASVSLTKSLEEGITWGELRLLVIAVSLRCIDILK